METSLIILVIVEIGTFKYVMSRQVCKRMISCQDSFCGAMRHAMRTKIRIDSGGSFGKRSDENHMLRQY